MQWLREWIKAELLKRNAVLSRPPGQFSVAAVKFANARRRGLNPKMIIDGGAAEGGWAADVKQIWPDAQVLCIEPRDAAQPALKDLAAKMPGIHVAQTLVGAEEGTIEFYESGHQSSILKDAGGKDWGKKVTAPITTLDNLVTKLGLGDPDMIKLDLQGAEIDCLKGASRCLAHAEAVLLEVSLIEFQKGMPLVGEIIPFMSQRGFRLYDVISLWHRPLDGALAQGDWLFVANGSKLWADARWEAT